MMFSVCLFLKHNLVIFITEKREDVNFGEIGLKW